MHLLYANNECIFIFLKKNKKIIEENNLIGNYTNVLANR
jgi:hypothetical protein